MASSTPNNADSGAAGPAVAGGPSPQAVTVTWLGGLSAGYQVVVTPSMKALAWLTSKTATGFTANLDNGGSAGTIDVLVVSG